MQSLLQLLCGALLPTLQLLVGGYFALRLLPLLCRRRRSGKRARGALSSLAVALSGTLGVGNIAGVALAIAMGGAGAVFWMWVSALFAMLLKYAEVALAMQTRRYDRDGRAHGGAYYYIKVAFKGELGRALAALFAALCALCSLTLGGVLQSAVAAEAAQDAFGVPRLAVGLVLGVGAALVLWLGAKGVERACSAVLPVVCALFAVASLAAIFLHFRELPRVLGEIFGSAFSWQSGLAGASGFFASSALRYGVMRGLVSNEAGCGTAPIAHAASAAGAREQGLLGIFEVFVDTVLLCTLTALVLLCADVPRAGEGGMHFALAAYTALLGPIAAPVLALSVLLFAFATVLCWSHYGAEALCYFTDKGRAPRIHALLVALACALGAVAVPQLIWDMTDLLLALMAFLNIAALVALRRTVCETARI